MWVAAAAGVIRILFPSILRAMLLRGSEQLPCRAYPFDVELYMFVLDARLVQDTFTVGDFPLSRLLLSNDSNYPWFILVPRRADIAEVFELSESDQLQLWKETVTLSSLLNAAFKADKINVAALGNVVSQLHMHVIVRYRADVAWPAPVWGKHTAQPYSSEQVAALVRQLKDVLPDDFKFAQDLS